MAKLLADFLTDWVRALRDHLISVQGWDALEIQALDDRDVPIRYFEALRRRIAPRPRILRTANDFICPAGDTGGWQTFQQKVRAGGDLNPHLSTRHASLLNNDGLLAEWGVHHFHLGVAPNPRNPTFVKRTGSLVYAMVTDDTFYAINVYTHRDFEADSIIESIHRNWPERVSRYRMKAVTGGQWPKELRRTLRGKNANVLVTVADGTVYMPISGGVMASGVNAQAVREADYWWFHIRDVQINFEAQLPSLIPTLSQQGYAGEDEIDAELKIDEAGYLVLFPKYNVVAIIVIKLPPASSTNVASIK